VALSTAVRRWLVGLESGRLMRGYVVKIRAPPPHFAPHAL
jgi:hypothetical protein